MLMDHIASYSFTFFSVIFFFFQAEDGIRDLTVTGVQTCALPISVRRRPLDEDSASVRRALHADRVRAARGERVGRQPHAGGRLAVAAATAGRSEIGRASCRERV